MSSSTIHNVCRLYKVAAVPTDGIGPEVISADIQVLNKLASILDEFEFQFTKFDWGSEVYKSTSKYIPDGGLGSLKGYDAILFGAVGDRATEVAIFSRHAVERLMRFASKCAQQRRRKKITVVTKSNAQRNGMVLWDEVAAAVAKEFPDVEVDKMLVDAMTVRMTLQPNTLDTIVATNLHADILSDLAAALAGSIGIAPTSNLDPSRKHP
ncbi:MAG: hypothetical protein Q9192_006218, partial [Flavoplaca navasiana]